MKQFLYLDTDFINSIIAQAEKGLVESASCETQTTSVKEKVKEGSAELDATVGGNLLKLIKAEGELNVNGTIGSKDSESSASKEIISKTLHDAAFDIAYQYMNPNIINYNDNQFDDFGNYVSISRVYDFVDLDYLEKLFDKGDFVKLLKKDNSQKKQGEKPTDWNEVHLYISAFKQIIPYSRMLTSYDGYLAPLDDKYFRVNPQSIGFQYGGEMTCVGVITNIIGKDCGPDDNNVFASYQHTINETLRSILPTKEDNICVIHPIAVFYES